MLVCGVVGYSQEEFIVISGEVMIDSLPIQDVHIINKKLEIGAISDADGKFEILGSQGDLLLISHINFELQEETITEEVIQQGHIIVELKDKNNLLEEVVIKKRKGIFEVDKDIMTYNGPVVNAKTLRLPYAGIKINEEDNLIRIESGAVVSLDKLIELMPSKHKQEKKKINELKALDHTITNIREHFTDGFFIRQLKIKEELINDFLNYSISKGIIQLYKKEKHLELTTVLIESRKHFTIDHKEVIVKTDTIKTK